VSAFPFKSYRKGQKEAIDKAREAFKKGKRFVVIEAPTGSGKSAIAVTFAREAKSSYILTAQKILQEQYVRDFPDLSLMKGRSNYACLVAPTHAAAAPCITGKRFPQCDDCPYFAAKETAIAANTATMNYAYYLAELNYSGGFQPRELLILDEAHNAEAALMSFIQITLSDSRLTALGLTERIPTVIDDLEYFDFAEQMLPGFKTQSKKLEDVLKKTTSTGDAAIAQMQNKQYLDNQIRRIEMLKISREEDFVEWVVERGRNTEGQWLTFKPVKVSSFAQSLLFDFADKVLMLSATILDAPTYLRSLGIHPEQAEVITVDSDFPPENRPIYVRPVAKMTRHSIEKDMPKLLKEIVELMESHPNDKGVIHAHSYKIAGYIAKNLPKTYQHRLVTHYGSDGREAALDKHTRSIQPTVLLTPSMTEGIDLADDLSRWQVICKIPYPYLGDPQVAKRKDIDAAWYDWKTCLTVVQAYGRSIRSADDYAVTYVLDADFATFVKRQEKRLPRWFLEAIVTAEGKSYL
jgi:ATP-dependent DNA helicase DinG